MFSQHAQQILKGKIKILQFLHSLKFLIVNFTDIDHEQVALTGDLYFNFSKQVTRYLSDKSNGKDIFNSDIIAILFNRSHLDGEGLTEYYSIATLQNRV